MPRPLSHLSDFQLAQHSIHTGCETELNRQADTELKYRGFIYKASEAQWVHPATNSHPAYSPRR